MEETLIYSFLFFVFLITMIGGWIPTVKSWSAETFRMIADSSIGHERVDTVDNSRTLEDSIAAMLLSST